MSQPMLPLFLGRQLPAWEPRTIDDVQAAIDNGTLRERHWVDFKGGWSPGPDGATELARDLASFANDGGCLVYGISERKVQATIAPVDLIGKQNHVDQVTDARCDPPLVVESYEIRVDDDPSKGLLIIHVPPSAQAPHQVDGRYYGRNDSTKHVLADHEVAALHARRNAMAVDTEQLVRAEIQRDPTLPELRKYSHLFVVAQPVGARSDLTTALIHDQATLLPTMRSIGGGLKLQGYEPRWDSLMRSEPRAAGRGWHSGELSGRRVQLPPEPVAPYQLEQLERRLADLEVHDSGKITVFVGRGSFDHGERAEFYGGAPAPTDQSIVEVLVAYFARGVVMLGAELGRQAGFGGQWQLGVGLTKTDGKDALLNGGSRMYPGPKFSASEFIGTTTSSTTEMRTRAGAVTQRMIFPLLRGIGAEQFVAGILDDAAE